MPTGTILTQAGTILTQAGTILTQGVTTASQGATTATQGGMIATRGGTIATRGGTTETRGGTTETRFGIVHSPSHFAQSTARNVQRALPGRTSPAQSNSTPPHPDPHQLAPITSIPRCRSRRPYAMRQSIPHHSRKSGNGSLRPAADHRKLTGISLNHRTQFSNQLDQRTCIVNSNQSGKRQRPAVHSLQSEPEASAPVSAFSGLKGQHIHCRG